MQSYYPCHWLLKLLENKSAVPIEGDNYSYYLSGSQQKPFSTSKKVLGSYLPCNHGYPKYESSYSVTQSRLAWFSHDTDAVYEILT